MICKRTLNRFIIFNKDRTKVLVTLSNKYLRLLLEQGNGKRLMLEEVCMNLLLNKNTTQL